MSSKKFNKKSSPTIRLADSVINNDAKPTYCKESESCCKLIEDKETAEDSIVIESNEIPKPVSRQCGKQNFVGIESRIGDGDTAQYGESRATKSISQLKFV